MRRRTQCAAICMLAIMSASVMMSTGAVAEEQTETTLISEDTGTAEDTGTTEEAADAGTADGAAAAEETELTEESGTEEAAGLETDAVVSEEAEENDTELVAVSTELEGCWDQVAIANPDTVATGVNIRSAADQNSEVLGFLYEGCAVWVLEKGDMWTEFYSNGITGYVMNDYLIYGEGVSELASSYAAQGVRTEWDGVVAYSAADGASEEVAVLSANKSFALLEDDGGHWLKILLDKDTVAYVSSDDVIPVILFEPATPKDGDRVRLGGLPVTSSESYEEYTEADEYTETEETYVPETDYVPETNYIEETGAQTEYVQETSAQTEYVPETSAQTETTAQTETAAQTETTAQTETAAQTETTAQTETAAQTETSAQTETAAQTETSAQTETAAQTETTAQTETSAQTETTEQETTAEITDSSDEVIDAGDGGYYDADTDTYYDADGNVVQETVTSAAELETEASLTYEETEAASTETAATEASYTETAAAEASYTETTAAEASYTETAATEAASTATTDDTTLLAALIYCEAGNQSYDGMVAVGAVVMNRVNSSSFPNTISEVIYQSGQFSPASSGALASAIANGVPSACYEAAAAAISGVNPVGNALYFNTTAGTGTQIGDHWFY